MTGFDFEDYSNQKKSKKNLQVKYQHSIGTANTKLPVTSRLLVEWPTDCCLGHKTLKHVDVSHVSRTSQLHCTTLLAEHFIPTRYGRTQDDRTLHRGADEGAAWALRP